MRPIWLDLARLIERASVGALSGIDRVELAYARSLLRMAPDRVRFVMLPRWSSRFTMLPQRPVARFLDSVAAAWRDGSPRTCRGAAIGLLARGALCAEAVAPRGVPAPVYLLVSHRHLERRPALDRALRGSGASFVPLVHDLIPLTHPEYGRPGEAERHRRRIASVAAMADAVIANSAATAAMLRPFLPAGLPLLAAPLGVDAAADVAPEVQDRPYFLCVGTIEPRKNHLLLLHLWRRLVAALGEATPRLVLVGRRGWENENILDLLDRCPALRGYVEEVGTVPDGRLAALMRGARGLLMPSFAEGFGLPVAEALACGCPVLASDLPALREAGGSVPEYLDPLDTPTWKTAVLDYAVEVSARRAAQLERLQGWQPVAWESHLADVVAFVDATIWQPRCVVSRPAFGLLPAPAVTAPA